MMASVTTLQLIERVKQHPCLYDPYHKEYKNIGTKHEIWEAIGREFNCTPDVIKNKWKTLRDSYTKNKKQQKTEKGFIRAYTWAPQLAFLDDFIQKPPSTMELSSSPITIEFDPFASIDNDSLLEKEIPLEDTVAVEDSTSTIPSKKPTKRPISEDEDDVTRIINFLTKKRKKEDAISLLFLSYAETFRKFPLNEQISLKVKLAKLFSDVEKKLFDNVENQNTFQEEHIANVKIEPQDSCEFNNEALPELLQEKEEELLKANKQLISVRKELETLKTRNLALETRNGNLESVVDDLKNRLNNLF